MTAASALAWRIEWNGRGPFWCEKSFRLIDRLCRQTARRTNSQTQPEEGARSFLAHYAANAPSPYDHPGFDFLLSRAGSDQAPYRFGFTDKHALQTQLGLDDASRRQQFDQLFLRDEFAVRAYLVRPLASSQTEHIFLSHMAELVAQARTPEEFAVL